MSEREGFTEVSERERGQRTGCVIHDGRVSRQSHGIHPRMMKVVDVIMWPHDVFKQHVRCEEVDEEVAVVCVGGEGEDFIGQDVGSVSDGVRAWEGGGGWGWGWGEGGLRVS